MMQLPIVAPAPVVTEHAGVFRDLFDNHCQFRHVQYYLTGLIILPHKSMTNIARWILDSADKTNLSRVLAEAPWREEEVHRRRVTNRLWPSMIPCASTWGASLTMWIGTTTTATAPIP